VVGGSREEVAMSLDTLNAELPVDAVVKARLDFAQRCFTNVQELSRFMDQKAGSLISAVSLLNIALGIVAAQTLNLPADGTIVSAIHLSGLGLFVVYLFLAVTVIVLSTNTFRALPNIVRQTTPAPGLMFPLILLKRIRVDAYVEEERYLEKLGKVTVDEMLQDYANQIVEVSAIYERKQLQINRATTIFHWLCGCWMATLLLLLSTLVIGAH
jgi:hypothetical protein